jgi:hypothetical protein
MAFKMKGYTYSGTSPLKNPGEHKHPHEQTGYRPGDVMDESNSSAEMRRLAALDTEVEYEADKNNKEWQRRGDLNKARLKYAKSLGTPTSDDVLSSEARRKSRQ